MGSDSYAWAAGFYDGEGSTILTTPRSTQLRNVRMCISQVNREVLDKFQAVFDEGTVRGPYGSRSQRKTPLYQYEAAGYARCARMMELMWEHLGTLKREQFLRCKEVIVANGIPFDAKGEFCRRGHSNWHHLPDGRRVCRTCQYETNKASRDRFREQNGISTTTARRRRLRAEAEARAAVEVRNG